MSLNYHRDYFRINIPLFTTCNYLLDISDIGTGNHLILLKLRFG